MKKIPGILYPWIAIYIAIFLVGIGAFFNCAFGQVNTFPWTNNFENAIGLNEMSNDDGDWALWTGSTYSPNTGPQGDHTTGNGIYYYTEASVDGVGYPYKTFITQTPVFDITNTPGKIVSFWYHMYGNHMGDLEVSVGDYSFPGIGQTVLGTVSGDQGEDWHLAYYTIPSGILDSFVIIFKGTTGGGWTSDICIDDIYVGDPYTIGCMDPAATNYNSSAIVDDGSCVYPPCAGFISSNAYELCWGSQTGIVFEWWQDTASLNCNAVHVYFGDENGYSQLYGGFWSASNGYNNFAVGAGNGQMPPNWNLEYHLVLEYEDGTLSDTIFYTPSACIPGCTDSTQQSYNPWATIDDGSCSGTTCDTATQYQITMEVTLDNWPGETSWIMNSAGVIGEAVQGTYTFNDIGQTFTYNFCVDQNAGFELILNDSYGDGMAGSTTGGTLDGNVVIYDCNGDTIWMLPDPNFGHVTYSGAQQGLPCATTPNIYGCTDNDYQEYNSLANNDDGSCINLHVYGCMDSSMYNYDPTATIMDLISDCNYTLTIKDAASDGWGNSYLGVSQGNMSWTYTMGPGSSSQSFPLMLNSDQLVEVYYFEVGGPQTPPEEVQFQTWHNSFYLINSLGDTLLAEGTNPFASNGQGALQAFEAPFWTTYSSTPSCGNYCESVVVGCMDSIAYNYNNLANTNDICYYQPGCMNPGYLEYYTQGFVADVNDGSCSTSIVSGCTDSTAFNYDPLANLDNGGCLPIILGCMNSLAFNYNPNANTNDTCIPVIYGCMSSIAINYDSLANTDDGSCIGINYGCTDSTMWNYSPSANTDDGSCIPYIYGCMDQTMWNYDPLANTDNGACIPFTYGCMDSIMWNYDPLANTDNGSCIPYIYGCTDSTATNYNPLANISDNSCIPYLYGCTDSTAINYNALANTNDGSCIAMLLGCTDSLALNYNSLANTDDGSCIAIVNGCMDPTMFNYDPLANVNDGSCVPFTYGCTDITAFNYDSIANIDDGSCIAIVYGCLDITMFNYCDSCNVDNGSCIPFIYGCIDSNMFNYDPLANTDNSTCIEFIYGCTNPLALNYNSAANTDDFSCILPIYGCMDSLAFNYNPLANIDNGSCIPVILGCTDPIALNYCDSCNTDDFSCILPIYGCTDSTMFNYNPLANVDNNSCEPYVYGCTDPSMLNYDPNANTEDFSCIPYIYGCMDSTAFNYDSLSNTDNGSCITIVEGCMDQSAYNYNVTANVHDSISCLYNAGCITGAGNPYWLNDPCYAWVISVDDYCCENEWDTICQLTYNYCDSTYTGPIPTRESLTLNEIKVYPNPTSDIININKFVDVWVINTLGDMIMYKTDINVLDVSRLSPGVYNLQIMCDNKIVNKRIVKK